MRGVGDSKAAHAVRVTPFLQNNASLIIISVLCRFRTVAGFFPLFHSTKQSFCCRNQMKPTPQPEHKPLEITLPTLKEQNYTLTNRPFIQERKVILLEYGLLRQNFLSTHRKVSLEGFRTPIGEVATNLAGVADVQPVQFVQPVRYWLKQWTVIDKSQRWLFVWHWSASIFLADLAIILVQGTKIDNLAIPLGIKVWLRFRDILFCQS